VTSTAGKALLITSVFWQLVCVVMMPIYWYSIAYAVIWAYGSFADVQTSYGRFERLTTYLGITIITLPPTFLSLAAV
jgi:hypothetical protein